MNLTQSGVGLKVRSGWGGMCVWGARGICLLPLIRG